MSSGYCAWGCGDTSGGPHPCPVAPVAQEPGGVYAQLAALRADLTTLAALVHQIAAQVTALEVRQGTPDAGD